jgi:hypothetical protein
MAKWKTPPVIAGGTYRRIYRRTVDGSDLIEFAVMGPTRVQADGRVTGMFRRFGLPEMRITEGEEELASWDLVATPQTLDEPIRGEARLDEKTRLERENEFLKRRLAQVEGSERVG